MSQNTLALVSKYLDTSKVNSIVLELSRDLENNSEDLNILCDLLDQVDANTVSAVCDNAKIYLDHLIDNVTDEGKVDNFVKLTDKLPILYSYYIDRVHEILSRFMQSSAHKFIPEIKPILETQLNLTSSEENSEIPIYDIEYIIYLLRFLEITFTSPSAASKVSQKLDQLLCFLVTFNVEDIYTISLRILKLRITPIIEFSYETDFFWNIIFSLVANERKSHQTNGYILWLKYLNNENSADKLQQNSFFQTNILQKDCYFDFLQVGLVSEAHEHRKLCISVLKVSILSISSNVNTKTFKWDVSNKQQYMKEWERFLTVFEIMAIDTSLHQAEAASSDIIGLINRDNLIHPSWGFRLLSTGFRAGTDSIRKFTLNLLLSIPSENLHLIKFALPILEDIFLPYMMTANHLIVFENECPYGETLLTYVKDMLLSCQSIEDTQILVSSILTVINNSKEAFDPCKIYVLLGVLKGLESVEGSVLEFGIHEDFLVPLFEIKSEGILYHKVLQTITLKLLLSFKFDLVPFLKCIDKFIKFNNSTLINANLPLLQEYLETNKLQKSDLNKDFQDDFLNALAYYFMGIIDEDKKLHFFEDSRVFANFLGSQPDLTLFDSSSTSDWIFKNILAFVESPQSYDSNTFEALGNSSPIPLSQSLNVDKLWSQIENDVLLAEESVLRTVVFKYKFLNNILVGNTKNNNVQVPFTINKLVEFKKLAFKNVNNSSILAKDFYKVKEELFGEFYKTINYFTDRGEVISEHLSAILPEISANLSNYGSNFHITSFLNKFLNLSIVEQNSVDEINSILEILLEIWDNLAAIRLQLHQKDLHKLLIETILNHKILSVAISNEDLVESLMVFIRSVIKNSMGRRSLLPALTQCLSNYQINHPESFNQSTWLCQALVECFTVYQLKSNAFKIEPIIGDVFDDNFGDDKDPLYLKIYQSHELSSKINLLAIFNTIKSSEFANNLLLYILKSQKQYNFYKVIKSTDAYEQWIRLRLATIILSIVQCVDNEVMEQHLHIFIGLLGSDPSPLVRVYLEWIVALKIIDLTQFQDQIFEDLQKLMNTKENKPTLVCCYQRILMLMIKQLPSASPKKSELLQKLLSIIIPGATSNKALIRHFSTSLVCNVYSQLDGNKSGDISPTIWDIMSNIYQATSQVIDMTTYRNGDAILWDIKKDLTLVNLSGTILMRTSDHVIEYFTREQSLDTLSQSQIDNLNVEIGQDDSEYWIPARKNQAKKANVAVPSAELLNKTPLQTKSGAWSSIMDVDENRGNDIARSDLIVVSSLVDKPPNLGGICRLCDVLGAGLLTLHDINVKDHPEFKSVAVTADYWMPMCEVTIDGIIPFLRQKKQDGYTLIGLEQTDKSVQLNNELKFPKKSLVLLGKEREGIPGDLLAELDFCVEIKQVGVIRSMNIQTATAIIVHAYSSQHC